MRSGVRSEQDILLKDFFGKSNWSTENDGGPKTGQIVDKNDGGPKTCQIGQQKLMGVLIEVKCQVNYESNQVRSVRNQINSG